MKISHRFKQWLTCWLIYSIFVSLTLIPSILQYGRPETVLSAVYLPLATIGQGFFLTFLMSLVLLIPNLVAPKWTFRLWALLGGALLFLLLVNTQVFRIYRFHINAFLLDMFFNNPKGMGVGIWTFLLLGIGLVVLVWAMHWLVHHISQRIKMVGLTVLAFFLMTFTGQVIHAWAYAHNIQPIVSLTHYIPWYIPLEATKDMKKWGLYNEALAQQNLKAEIKNPKDFQYPRNPIQCEAEGELPNILIVGLESWRFDRLSPEVTPNMYRIAEESLNFPDHLSTGSVTDRGLFGLMYGVSPIYFMTANAAARKPVLLEVTKQLGYKQKGYVHRVLSFRDLDSLLLHDIPPVNPGEVPTTQGDVELMELAAADLIQSEGPFFGFVFLKSSHFPYDTPEGYDRPFLPAENLRMSKVTATTEPEPFFNQYSNSLHFNDSLVGELRLKLETAGKWENTIIVFTGDHGEEFRDQETAYWGHGSNFTRFQVGVPLVIHWPGKQLWADYRTSHEDVAVTLINDALKCAADPSDFTTGTSLFDSSARTNVLESYVNKAIVTGDNVTELYPGFTDNYLLDSIAAKGKADATALQGVQSVYGQFR